MSKKKLVNELCSAAGAPPIYADIELSQSTGGVTRPDQYFGRPLATVVREILQAGKSRGLSAISLETLYDSMKAGGYQFDNKDSVIAARNVAIALGKNPAFIKVPNTDTWGLAEWYPGATRYKRTSTKPAEAVANPPPPIPAVAEDEEEEVVPG